MALYMGKLRNVPCTGYSPTSGTAPGMLTYMCEARPIEAMKTGATTEEACHFPFTHNGVYYDTCAQSGPSNSDIATKGKPFCALKVNSTNGVMMAGEWGICKDERTIAYAKTLSSDEVTGQFCSVPFKLNNK